MWVNPQFYADMFTCDENILNLEVKFLYIDLGK